MLLRLLLCKNDPLTRGYLTILYYYTLYGWQRYSKNKV